MIDSSMLYIFALVGVTVWLGLKHAIAAHEAEVQTQIARQGVPCQGRVVAIQRPFMLDACTRLYVDFVPVGHGEPVRVCHVDRRAPEDARSLPVPGATVTVRYLPDHPERAVIGKLVATM